MMLKILFNLKIPEALAEGVIKLNNTWIQNILSIIKYGKIGRHWHLNSNNFWLMSFCCHMSDYFHFKFDFWEDNIYMRIHKIFWNFFVNMVRICICECQKRHGDRITIFGIITLHVHAWGFIRFSGNIARICICEWQKMPWW